MEELGRGIFAALQSNSFETMEHLLIDWSSATMKGVRMIVRDPETYEEREVDDATLKAEQRPAAAVQILFETGDRVREISLQDCLKTSRGWLVMETLSLRQ